MFDFSNPMQFMQLLFSPEMTPQMMEQAAGQLAMKAQPPALPQAQAPMPMGAPGAEMLGLTPGPQLAQGGAPIPQVPLPPGLGPIPGLYPQGGAIMPGEEAGMPTDQQKLAAALSAQQMMQYQKMLEPSNGPVISPPSPPGGRQIGAMQQLQMSPSPGMPMSLAALLGGRR